MVLVQMDLECMMNNQKFCELLNLIRNRLQFVSTDVLYGIKGYH